MMRAGTPPNAMNAFSQAGQKERHLLRDGEFQVHAPAVAQHHQKKAQAPPCRAHADGAVLTPVELGGFAWGEVQLEKRLLVAWPDAVHVVLDDGDAAVKAGLAQALKDLLRAVGMGIEPAHDLPLVGIELAHARFARAWAELLHVGPLGDRAYVQRQGARRLGYAELLAAQVVADLAEGLIVQHGGSPVQ